jgi:hypothetical protein
MYHKAGLYSLVQFWATSRTQFYHSKENERFGPLDINLDCERIDQS